MKKHIDLDKLEKAIFCRHHAMERFYDIDEAANDRDRNNEMLARIKAGEASIEDQEAAMDIIASYA